MGWVKFRPRENGYQEMTRTTRHTRRSPLAAVTRERGLKGLAAPHHSKTWLVVFGALRARADIGEEV
jgi:hypothetical protein